MTDLINSLEKILTLSNSAITFFACIVLGYVLRFIKKFPNNGIPLVVVMNGSIVMVLLADPRISSIPMHTWATRYMAVGAIIGCIAWISHKLVISKLEDLLASRFDFVDKMLNGKAASPPTPPTDTTKKP